MLDAVKMQVEERIASTMKYGGAVTAAGSPVPEYFGLTPPEITLLLQVGGFVVGVIGLAASLWFQWDRRRQYREYLTRQLNQSREIVP